MSETVGPSALRVDERRVDRHVGCLLGGAVGDALGAPVEFDSLAAIRARCGPQGVTGYLPAYGRIGAVTDDTQMTLFTAEGLIRASRRYEDLGMWDARACLHGAYLRWLSTQTGRAPRPSNSPGEPSGWLLGVPELHHRRAPGNTCLSALGSPEYGTPLRPLNHSKGCGGVMRVAPVGLIADDPFGLGCQAAALTHGHPSGYLAAGALAAIVSRLLHGHGLPEAVDAALVELRTRPGHEETLQAVGHACDLARTVPPSPEMVERLGAGWVAEEALAISLYCALVAESFEHGVLLAVNHSGDSDSTGAITGNLLGVRDGAASIPEYLLEPLELRDVLEQVAVDLAACSGVSGPTRMPDLERYPTW